LGGVAYNVASNLANLTNNVYLQCAVGNDNDGHRLLAQAKTKGINICNSLVLDNKMTSRYYAILDRSGEMHMGLADMEIYNDLPLDIFTGAWSAWEKNSIIFIDTNLPAEILQQAIQLCNKKQLQLCIDPVSVSKAKKLPASLTGVFLIKPDRLEAAILADMPITSLSDCIKAGQILLKRGVEHVVISLGETGYVIVDDSYQIHLPAIHVNPIVDVSGSGDAFIAGILYELAQGANILQACETGAAAAALTLQSLHTVTENMSYSNLINQKNRNKHDEKIF
jgi:pseudouridine kinase